MAKEGDDTARIRQLTEQLQQANSTAASQAMGPQGGQPGDPSGAPDPSATEDIVEGEDIVDGEFSEA